MTLIDENRPRPVPGNLVPDLNDVNAFATDKIAVDVIGRHAPWAWERADALGAKVWDPRVLKAARDAQRFTPELRTLNRIGEAVYDVDPARAWDESSCT